MKNESPELVTPMLLEKVGKAFNGNDIDAVMECFAPDAIFDHALGSEAYGTRFHGNDALKKVFSGLFESV